MQKRKIAVLGGGNMGLLLSVKFSQDSDVTLYLNSNKKVQYHKDMRAYNSDKRAYTTGKIQKITTNLAEATSDAEWIFVTFPSFVFESFASKLLALLKSGQHLVFVPGSGGAELYFKDALKKGCTISGLQRVHSVARITEAGKEVCESGVRNMLKVASVPQAFNEQACKVIGELYDIEVAPLNSYLNVTLINSNPILHTSRLFTIFKDYVGDDGNGYDKLPLFYEHWTDEASCLLEKMDNELFDIIGVLNKNGMKVDDIVPLLKHYESKNVTEMTAKIKSINSLKGLATPSKARPDGKLVPDLNSRYFTADFPFGLDILIAFADLTGTPCPHMLSVSDWYHNLTKTKREFDLGKFGIYDINDLKNFY